MTTMTINTLKPYIYPVLHVLGWLLLGYILLFYIPLTWNVTVPAFFWIWQTIVLVMMIALFYINGKVVVARTLIEGKTTLFILWLLAVIFVTQLLAYLYTTNTGMRTEMSKLLGDRVSRNQLIDNFVFTITLLVMGISTSWAMLQNWQQAAQRHQQLEQQQTMAELSLLKAQINPHFFFNTLNNIYALTYINVENSRNALHTLSRMMRYLLYSTEDEKTTLQKEVSFLRDYVSLMRLRSNDKLRIIVSIPEKLDDYKIAPMLLLPFVENAFKHGVDATQHSEIKIVITQNAQQLELEVENNIFSNNRIAAEEGGIGLVNTSRRLELIYPGKHTLRAGLNNHGNYEVNLQLELEA